MSLHSVDSLRGHYAAVRARLGVGVKQSTVSLWHRNPARLYATRYAAPIGPQRVIYVLPPKPQRSEVLAGRPMSIRQERDFIADVCIERGLSYCELLGEGKGRLVVSARAIVAHRLAKGGRSSVYIGRMLKKDHSSILKLLGRYTAEGERIR